MSSRRRLPVTHLRSLRLRIQEPACKNHACNKKSACEDKILRVQKVPNEGL